MVVAESKNLQASSKVSCWRLMRPGKVGGMTSLVPGLPDCAQSQLPVDTGYFLNGLGLLKKLGL